MNSMIRTLRKIPLIHQIAVGLIIGILIAVFLPGAVPVVGIFGDLFVRALKGVAPLLVFILVMNAMVQRKEGGDTQMKPIITLYVIGTFAASIVGVVLSFLFPQTLMLQLGNAKVNPPSGIAEVVHNLVLNIVDNPLNAILNANYIGILAWAVIIGLALHKAASPETKHVLEDLSAGITKVVTWVIHFAPLGIMGLVTQSISASGLSALISYFSLLGVLLGSYFLVALVMNPIIVYLNVRKNPYPLVWATIRESGIYAFFTRSSAANIPVNLTLCKRLGLNPDTYTISIPLGVWSHRWVGGAFDWVHTAFNQLCMAVPPFFTGILLSWLFGIVLHWFTPGAFPSLARFGSAVKYLLFAAVAIAIPRIAMTVRMLRSTILSEMQKDYVRTAISRGNDRSGVLVRHVLKNALVPVVTFLAQTMAEIVAGSIVVEQVFGIPGLGRMLVVSIANRDYPVVQAIVVILAFWLLV